METTSAVQIGILSPATPNRPHFKSLDGILPPGVSIVHEGLGLLGESYQDLVGKTDRVVELAKNFVERHRVRGLMVTGGFVTLFNRCGSIPRSLLRQTNFLSEDRHSRML